MLTRPTIKRERRETGNFYSSLFLPAITIVAQTIGIVKRSRKDVRIWKTRQNRLRTRLAAQSLKSSPKRKNGQIGFAKERREKEI